MTHTPTPWKFEALPGWGGDHVIFVDPKNPIAKTYRHSDVYYTHVTRKKSGGASVTTFAPKTEVGELRKSVCIEEEKANAEFIVRACNAHDELLAAAKAAANLMGWDEGQPVADTPRRLISAIAQAEAA